MLKRTLCLICSLSTGSFKYNVRYMRHIDAVTLGRKVQTSNRGISEGFGSATQVVVIYQVSNNATILKRVTASTPPDNGKSSVPECTTNFLAGFRSSQAL